MDKFSDNLGSIPAGTYEPQTVASLLRRLGVQDAPADEQERALRRWLATNTPSDMMAHSIRRGGYHRLLT